MTKRPRPGTYKSIYEALAAYEPDRHHPLYTALPALVDQLHPVFGEPIDYYIPPSGAGLSVRYGFGNGLRAHKGHIDLTVPATRMFGERVASLPGLLPLEDVNGSWLRRVLPTYRGRPQRLKNR